MALPCHPCVFQIPEFTKYSINQINGDMAYVRTSQVVPNSDGREALCYHAPSWRICKLLQQLDAREGALVSSINTSSYYIVNKPYKSGPLSSEQKEKARTAARRPIAIQPVPDASRHAFARASPDRGLARLSIRGINHHF
jgi:hypothetical protein